MGPRLRVLAAAAALLAAVTACTSSHSTTRRTVRRHAEAEHAYPVPSVTTPVPSDSPSGPPPSKLPDPECAAGNVDVQMPEPEGASGNAVATLVITAESHTCTLTGYPTLTLVNGNDKWKTTTARQPGTEPPATIRLAPHQKAFAYLEWARIGGNGDECVVRPTRLLVGLPNHGGDVPVWWPTGTTGSICGNRVFTSPFERG
ncbi:DUF4232 domain-containing protein [Cryptosporangium phraense]|uniref:DUF4232 domain-containing protein n=1 Tax=Cryptosporangium phraense TaxID=2593070 RepID=A0A545AXS1_9ACTN|nr:DUF4232 domain-containing protein [Cryptosporangium phraense]TQS46098.1 DUF4232 domain-containing protein [Cryptosporangium phraense]